jgi:hypothetical protein
MTRLESLQDIKDTAVKLQETLLGSKWTKQYKIERINHVSFYR